MRKREERERQLAVAEIEREKVELENELRGCHDTVAREREDLRARLESGAVDLRGARWQAHASLDAMRRSHHAALRLAGVFARIELARRALMAAASKRKAVELLRERAYTEWRTKHEKRERIELDEIGSRLAAAREAGES